jgi:hypothetical protein
MFELILRYTHSFHSIHSQSYISMSTACFYMRSHLAQIIGSFLNDSSSSYSSSLLLLLLLLLLLAVFSLSYSFFAADDSASAFTRSCTKKRARFQASPSNPLSPSILAFFACCNAYLV